MLSVMVLYFFRTTVILKLLLYLIDEDILVSLMTLNRVTKQTNCYINKHINIFANLTHFISINS